MSKDLIRYDLLVQDALKSVVRKVLGDTVRNGLPGEHHFYISFRTAHPAVRLSQRLRERYPDEMTIVLQHQYDGLTVGDGEFEVGLSFSGIPERLRVPFDALTGFFDPSVQFGLKFEAIEDAEDEAEVEPASTVPAGKPEPKGSVAKLPGRKAAEPKTDGKPAVERRKPKGEAARKPDPEEKAEGDGSAPGGEVVSLDAFRKKS